MKARTTSPVRWKAVLLALLLSLCMAQPALANEWNLKDKDGVHHKLSDQRGKWVLVNFWAPWCPDCLQEIPELNALQKQHKDVLVIGVAIMYKNTREVTDTARDKSISYPVVLGNEDIASEFGELVGMPTSFLYSPSGKLVGRHDGALTQKDVEQAMSPQAAPAGFFRR